MAYGAILGQKPPMPSIDETFEVGDTLTTLRKDLGENWVLADGGFLPPSLAKIYPKITIEKISDFIRKSIDSSADAKILEYRYLSNGNWFILLNSESNKTAFLYQISDNDLKSFSLIKEIKYSSILENSSWYVQQGAICDDGIYLVQSSFERWGILKFDLHGNFVSKYLDNNIDFFDFGLKESRVGSAKFFKHKNTFIIFARDSDDGIARLFISNSISGPYNNIKNQEYLSNYPNLFRVKTYGDYMAVLGNSSRDMICWIINSNNATLIKETTKETQIDDNGTFELSVIPEDNSFYFFIKRYSSGTYNPEVRKFDLGTGKFSTIAILNSNHSGIKSLLKFNGTYYGILHSSNRVVKIPTLDKVGIESGEWLYEINPAFEDIALNNSLKSLVEINYDEKELQRMMFFSNKNTIWWHQQKLPTIKNPENVNTFIKIK